MAEENTDNINDLAEYARQQEEKVKAQTKEAKKEFKEAMKEEVTKVTQEEKVTKDATTKTKEGYSVVTSEPFIEDSKEDRDYDPLKEELKKRHSEKSEGFLRRTKKKIAIRIGKLAFVLADAERAVYEKFHLNEPIMLPEEVDADYMETYNDTQELIDNRIGFESENGDVINVGITMAAHFG